MTYRNVNPAGVRELLDESDWHYVDVRTVEEFDQGHVPGAWNVPIAFRTPQGMQPNPDFLATIQRLFPRDAKIVFG